MAGTPAQNGNSAAGNSDFSRKAEELAAAINWPTPASRDHKGANGEAHLTNGTGRLHMDQLPNFVAHGFSLPDHQTRAHGKPSWRDRIAILRLLWAWIKSSYGRSVAMRLFRNRHTRRLNPLFVEWLMGWPPGHALCDCSETESFLWLQRMRGALSQLPTALGPWIWEPPTEMRQASQGNLFDE